VRADTKQGKSRIVISQSSAVRYLDGVYEINDCTNPQDYVFAGARLQALLKANSEGLFDEQLNEIQEKKAATKK
jgi:hypothetical protein